MHPKRDEQLSWVQGSRSSQTTKSSAKHVPSSVHISFRVQALPSSHLPVRNSRTQPVRGLQELMTHGFPESSHARGSGPLSEQCPSASHSSAPSQGSSSSHAVPLGIGSYTHAEPSQRPSFVHGSRSSGQDPLVALYAHLCASHVSVVQGFPSSHLPRPGSMQSQYAELLFSRTVLLQHSAGSSLTRHDGHPLNSPTLRSYSLLNLRSQRSSSKVFPRTSLRAALT